MHMRVRSIDANDQWGPWEQTSFLLPTLDVVDNGDGTATMTFSPTDTGLEHDFIQDATVNELSKTITYGDEATLESSMTSSSVSPSSTSGSLLISCAANRRFPSE